MQSPKTKEDDGVETSKEGLLSSRTYSLAHFARLLARADNSVRTASGVIVFRVTTSLAHSSAGPTPSHSFASSIILTLDSRGASTSPTLIDRTQSESRRREWKR
jgi:hypothetical protein